MVGFGGGAMNDSNARHNHLGQPVGFRVPGWTSRPMPPRTPMIGRFARVEPLDANRHASELFEANSEDREGRNWTYYNYGPFATLADYRNWVEDSSADKTRIFHAITDLVSGKAVGVAAYANIQPVHGTIEVAGLNFSPRLQRRPAATDAMYLMMRRAFEELGYRRYEWKCDSCNLPSRTAAARLGFTYEGLFRQAMVTRGNNRDTAWFSIIDREWPALRAALQAWLDPGNFDADGRQRRSLASLRAASE
jgi:RimJ/RimL family protein N-acetyltransferase